MSDVDLTFDRHSALKLGGGVAGGLLVSGNVFKATSTPLPQKSPSKPKTPFDAKRLAKILHGDAQVGNDGVVTVQVLRRDRIVIDGIHVSPEANISTNVQFQAQRRWVAGSRRSGLLAIRTRLRRRSEGGWTARLRSRPAGELHSPRNADQRWAPVEHPLGHRRLCHLCGDCARHRRSGRLDYRDRRARRTGDVRDLVLDPKVPLCGRTEAEIGQALFAPGPRPKPGSGPPSSATSSFCDRRPTNRATGEIGAVVRGSRTRGSIRS